MTYCLVNSSPPRPISACWLPAAIGLNQPLLLVRLQAAEVELRLQNTNIAKAAADITTKVVQPSTRTSRGAAAVPTTRGSLVISTSSRMSGGASTPLTTADQNNIFMALKCAKFKARPASTAAPITA